MLKLIIEDDEGRKTVVPFMRDEITIGRQEGNTIRLTERNVSRHHARLLRQNGHVLVEDLGSYNGVRINGERIEEPAQVKDGDLIQIGDYDLALQHEAAEQPIAPTVRVPSVAPQQEEALDEAPAQEAEAGSDEDMESDPPEEEAAEATPGDQRRHSTAVIRMDQVEMNRPRRVAAVHEEEAPRLVVVSAEFKGQEFSCLRTEMRIGRTDDNDIALDHRSLSRTHAKLVREDSGEWRVIDMQSANGLSVNGESYAQASLAHGDLIELGHVKLRFVGAGQSADGLMHDAAPRSSKKGLVLALVGLVLVGAGVGAAWFVYFGRPPPPRVPTPPPTVVEQPPQKPPETPPQQAQTPPTEPPPSTPPEQTPPTTATNTPPEDAFAEPLQRAQSAFATKDFDTVEATLNPLKDAKGQLPPKADELLKQASFERAAQKSLELARTELAAAKPQDAKKALQSAEGTKLFANELTELNAKVEAALKAPPKPGGTTKPAGGTAGTGNTELAKELYNQANTLLRQQEFREAEGVIKKCIEAAPEFAHCYVLMGATQARLKQPDEAANFYRQYLKLAPPDDALVPKVQKLVEDYEKAKKTQGGGK